MLNKQSFGDALLLEIAKTGKSINDIVTLLNLNGRSNYYQRMSNFKNNQGDLDNFLHFAKSIGLNVIFCFSKNEISVNSLMSFDQVVDILQIPQQSVFPILKVLVRDFSAAEPIPLGFLVLLLAISEDINKSQLAARLEITTHTLDCNLKSYNNYYGRIQKFIETVNCLDYQVSVKFSKI